MLGVLAKYIKDVSVLRRLLFAVVFLNPELPAFWAVVLEFATEGKISKCSATPEQIKTLSENIQVLNASAFRPDCELQQELISLHLPGRKPLGVILISPTSSCVLCGSDLQLRKDRHAAVVLYDMKLGTIPGAHFHKFCPKPTLTHNITAITAHKEKSYSMKIGPLFLIFFLPVILVFPLISLNN